MNAIKEILSQGFMITGFVMIMMLVIEYISVLTRGNWDHVIAKWKIGQSLLCSYLGATPGCLGAYAVGSLYIHRVIGIGALTAAMVATSGDEAFVMLALFPQTALWIFGSLFAGGVITGVVVDLFKKDKAITANIKEHKTSHPGNPRCIPFSARAFVSQWRNCSPQRGWLTLFLVLFLGGILTGAIEHKHGEECGESRVGRIECEQMADSHAGHNHADPTDRTNLHDTNGPTNQSDPSDLTKTHSTEIHDCNVPSETKTHASHEDHSDSSGNWVSTTFLVLSLIALLIVATVPDHFLDEHLWHHLVKVHGWRILLWTIGALAVTHVLVNSMDLTALVSDHKLPVLLTACLIGVLPTSGPHLIFVTLYSQGSLPLSVLVANCIVQDGHGMIPTLAHSRKTFIFIKALKLAIGLAVGLAGHFMGL